MPDYVDPKYRAAEARGNPQYNRIQKRQEGGEISKKVRGVESQFGVNKGQPREKILRQGFAARPIKGPLSTPLGKERLGAAKPFRKSRGR